MSADPSSLPHSSSSPSSVAQTAEQAQIMQMQAQMQQMYRQMQQQQQQLQTAQATAQQVATVAVAAPRQVELPKIRQPSSFSGTMGFAVDDWISEMHQQFAYYDGRFTDDAAKIRFAVAYFTGAAMHWWEHQPAVHSWNEFVSRLHGRYRPVHSAMLARQKLGKLRQRVGQSVNQYVSVFQNTLTPIVDMGDADQVHHFVNGLLGSIAAKVWEKHPTNLVEAIDAAVSVEAMSNYGRAAAPSSSASSSSSGAAPMDINNIEANDEEVDPMMAMMQQFMATQQAMGAQLNALSAAPRHGGNHRGGKSNHGGRPKGDRIDGLTPELIKELRAADKCFRCKEAGHKKDECPKRPKNA